MAAFTHEGAARLTQTVFRSFDQTIGGIIARLERHVRAADHAAIATQLLEAARFREEVKLKQREDLKIECERWLRPSEVRAIHQRQVHARLDGTCEWVESDDKFRIWVGLEASTARDRLLVISGKHGCGKSVLASSIVFRFEASNQNALFFAFSCEDGSRQTSESLIRTILWQLLNKIADLKHMEAVHKLRLDGQPTVSELWSAFENTASPLEEPMFCIIDGVDECADFDQNIYTRILNTLDACPKLHVLLLGRPHALELCLENPDIKSLDINSELLGQDIDAFIRAEIAKSDILLIPEVYKDVNSTLKNNSDGMFLWVRLVVDDLKKATSQYELSERLRQLPRGLEETYELVFSRIYQKLDKFELRLAQTVFAFTCLSCRPLRFGEFRYAYALHCRSLKTQTHSLSDHLLLQPVQRILKITGGLITATDGFLYLIHSSVKEFLIRPGNQRNCELDTSPVSFTINPVDTHRSLAWVCLDYMISETGTQDFLNPESSEAPLTPLGISALQEYATLYACYHLNRSKPICSTTIAMIKQFLGSRQSVFCAEYLAHMLFRNLALYSQINELDAFLDCIIDAGLYEQFSTIFTNTLKTARHRIRVQEKGDNIYTRHMELLLDIIKDSRIEDRDQIQNNRAEAPIPEPTTASLGFRIHCSETRPKDTHDTISRICDLVRDGNSWTIAHQIEVFLKLQHSLSKLTHLTDPLKLLFQLLLKKAASIPVYALVAIGNFYRTHEKHSEALQVFMAASKKVDHMDTLLKYQILRLTGLCYEELCLYANASKAYEDSYRGKESLLGERHHETLRCLLSVTRMRYCVNLYADVIGLSEKLSMGQDYVPELSIRENLILVRYRSLSYGFIGDFDKQESTKTHLGKILEKFCNSVGKGEKRKASDAFLIGRSCDGLGDHSKALDCFQFALESHQKSRGLNHISTLNTQSWMARELRHLGRIDEARELYETGYATQCSALGAGHCLTQLTKEILQNWEVDCTDECFWCEGACQSPSTHEWSPRDSERSSFEVIDSTTTSNL